MQVTRSESISLPGPDLGGQVNCCDVDPTPSTCDEPAVYNPSKPNCTLFPLDEDLVYDFQVTEDSGDPASISGQVVQSGVPVSAAELRVYDDPGNPDAYKSRTTDANGWVSPPLGIQAGLWWVEVWVEDVRRYRDRHQIIGLYVPEPDMEYEIEEENGPCSAMTIPVGQNTVGTTGLNVLLLFCPIAFLAVLRMKRHVKGIRTHQ